MERIIQQRQHRRTQLERKKQKEAELKALKKKEEEEFRKKRSIERLEKLKVAARELDVAISEQTFQRLVYERYDDDDDIFDVDKIIAKEVIRRSSVSEGRRSETDDSEPQGAVNLEGGSSYDSRGSVGLQGYPGPTGSTGLVGFSEKDPIKMTSEDISRSQKKLNQRARAEKKALLRAQKAERSSHR